MSASVRMDSMMSQLEFVQNNICQVRGEFLILPRETLQEALLEVSCLCFSSSLLGLLLVHQFVFTYNCIR